MQNIKYRIDNRFCQSLYHKFWDIGSLDYNVYHDVKDKIRINVKTQTAINIFNTIGYNIGYAKYK